MRRGKKIRGGDFFCGAGGFTTGLMLAAVRRGFTIEDFLAVNCNPKAIATHAANHPAVRHYCRRLEGVPPEQAVPKGRLDVLLASPECTHHSNARGGKPMNDQSRAGAFLILQWASQIYIDRILIENVKEFRDWGPLGANKRPIKSRKGECYRAFIDGLKALGYTVEERVLNAADYGAATSRVRLFIQTTRRGKIHWPKPTHDEHGRDGLKPWRGAAEIIDWSLQGESVFDRKKPLSEKTMARIWAGLEKFGLAPYIVPKLGRYQQNVPARDIRRPLPTVITDGRVHLAQPFLVPQNTGNAPRAVGKPVPTVTTTSRGVGMVQPYLVKLRGTNNGESAGKPLPTVTSGGNHLGVAEPFLVEVTHTGKRRTRSVREPLPTITGARRGELALCEPFVISAGGPKCPARGVGKPLGTVLTRDHRALVTPFLLPQQSGGALRPITKPVPTISGKGALGMFEPYLVKFYGTDKSGASVRKPLGTLTAKARFGLVRPVVVYRGKRYLLDIRFRMLQPHELAAAMGFPAGYKFAGNKTDQVLQIGNAVECTMAERLGECVLKGLKAA